MLSTLYISATHYFPNFGCISGPSALFASFFNWRQCRKATPHITLFSSPYFDPSKLENIVKNFSSKQESLPLPFGSIGSLPSDDNVLFLAPTPTLSLLQFHSHLFDAMKKEGIEIAEENRPDTWIPYCLVAEEVPKTRMGEAFTVLRDLKLPVAGYAMEIALVEYPPVREVFSFVLGNTVER
ncbi:hypothetical protein K7X08_017282 [Anisodus acutangulus]|uniref:Uncharacterized protein n=1 Tax=Anisodus acutangulus TaxID=402998 RepID=A0A9Q1LX12_9SOLA|nr:hypothetical protein K7X08_017282 [Anisodus acutangulus]